MAFLIRRASTDDLSVLAPLFDAYRQFYRKPADLALARHFLEERLSRNESVIFLALADSIPVAEALGFTQLYHTFCSTAAAPILVLYDLFVAPGGRRRGVGRSLMEAAHRYARDAGVQRVVLSTAHDNLKAQGLYESLGYQLDTAFRVYELPLREPAETQPPGPR
jgi:ribosomal protein S18 acetylase RimI-like enzyme